MHYKVPRVTLERVHINLNESVQRIVSLKNQGKVAEVEYLKIGPISDEIVDLLTVIEKRVASIK